MGNQNIDILRVFDTPANLVSNLREKMIGYDTTGNRFGAQLPGGGGMKYVSDDSKQGLLAGIQTYTGLKSWSANMTANANLTLGAGSNLIGSTTSDLSVRSGTYIGDIKLDTDTGKILIGDDERGELYSDGSQIRLQNNEGDVKIRSDLNDLKLEASSGIITISYPYITISGGTSLVCDASSGTYAPFRIPHNNNNPVILEDGDFWTTTAGAFVRINGVTKSFDLT